jgi:putative ABC transport system ATP-binding protein
MIELDDVHLTLASTAGPVRILNGIDLDLDAGTSLSVVGPSGSGKSSLLAIIGGIERATSGRVMVDGIDLATLDEDGLALFRRDRVGILFQSFHLIPTLTAAENVALPLELKGEVRVQPRAREALADVGLAERAHHYPAQLSGGEQQRVALARALINEPRLLLADEPTGNLDLATGRTITELILRVQAQREMTLVLITHDQRLAAQCERRIALEDGRVRELEPLPITEPALA